jgi:hypothetical protein
VRHAHDALAVEAWSPGEADLNRLDLGIALAHRGSPDEAAERGKQHSLDPGSSAACCTVPANSAPYS